MGVGESQMGGAGDSAFGPVKTGMPVAMQPTAPAEFPWDKFFRDYASSRATFVSQFNSGLVDRETPGGEAAYVQQHAKIPNWYDYLSQ